MLKTNYHTHSTFCDGKATARQMLTRAIEKHFDILGFSSHSLYPFSSDWHTSVTAHEDYSKEIESLKNEFSHQIEVVMGFEADYFFPMCIPQFSKYNNLSFKPQYLIGAVHYVPNEKGFFTADDSFENAASDIKKCCKDTKEAVCLYFEAEREMLKKGDFTFLAHPDLIRKQNSALNPQGPLFNEEDSWYKEQLKLTADSIKSSGICVEVNTGGMARGYLDTPYPSPYFLELLAERKVPVTINSDAHTPENLDYYFTESLEYIKKAGYKELMYFTSGQLKSQEIKL